MIAALCMIAAAVAADASYQLSAAKAPYFVCDDRVIMDRWLVERFVVPPKRFANNPILTRQFAWEGTGPHLGGSVLYDAQAQKFRMWYSVFDRNAYENKLPFSYNVCYAESEDGIAWHKPFLGVFEYRGSTENNVIKLGTDKTQNIDVCLNPRPDRWAGRFLSVHNQKGGIFVASSDDGHSFSRLWQEPALSYHSDTHNNFVYDEVRGRWFLYCRPRSYAGDHKRRVAMQWSDDLQHWSHEQTVLIPGEDEAQEFYGMTVWRRGDLFFGALQVYDRGTGHPHIELTWSGDGERWRQMPTHPAFVDRGPAGAWDAGMVFVAESPVEMEDEVRFYYGGFPLPHDTEEENIGAIGLLTAERDRFIGVRPRGDEPGFVLTRPFDVAGRDLLVNARVSGELRAEIRVANNKTVEGWTFDDCDPVTGSGYALPVSWRGRPLSAIAEKEVSINFKLDRAELFSFDLR